MKLRDLRKRFRLAPGTPIEGPLTIKVFPPGVDPHDRATFDFDLKGLDLGEGPSETGFVRIDKLTGETIVSTGAGEERGGKAKGTLSAENCRILGVSERAHADDWTARSISTRRRPSPAGAEVHGATDRAPDARIATGSVSFGVTGRIRSRSALRELARTRERWRFVRHFGKLPF